MAEPRSSVASRVLSVLGAIERARGPLQVSQIAESTGLPLATAWRMVRELVDGGGVEQLDDGRYRIATRVWAVGSSAPCVRRIQRDSSRLLRDLAAETGRGVHLSVLDQDSALVVSTAAPGGRVPPGAVQEGDRLTGDDPAARLLAAFGGSADDLPEPLREIRRHGLSVGRTGPAGTTSMSVGIANPAGAVVSALTLTGPAGVAWQRHVPALREAGAAVRYSIYREELPAAERRAR